MATLTNIKPLEMHAYVTPALFFGPNQAFSSMENDGNGDLLYLLCENDPDLVFEADGFVDADGVAFKGRKFLDMYSKPNGTVLLTEMLADSGMTRNHTIKVGLTSAFCQILSDETKTNPKKRAADTVKVEDDTTFAPEAKKPKLEESPLVSARFLEDVALIIHPDDYKNGLIELHSIERHQITWTPKNNDQSVRLHPTNFGNLQWRGKSLSEYKCVVAHVVLTGENYSKDKDVVPEWSLGLKIETGKMELVTLYMTALQFQFALEKPEPKATSSTADAV
jgi:hypothetical protein